jgi:hypothetical protein
MISPRRDYNTLLSHPRAALAKYETAKQKKQIMGEGETAMDMNYWPPVTLMQPLARAHVENKLKHAVGG